MGWNGKYEELMSVIGEVNVGGKTKKEVGGGGTHSRIKII